MTVLRTLVRSPLFDTPRHWREKIYRALTSRMSWPKTVAVEPDLLLTVDAKTYPSQTKYYWIPEAYEPSLQWALRNLIPLGGQMVDCGSNLALMGLIAARHRNAQVLCLEPLPRLRQWIEQHIEMNGLQGNMRVLEIAASNEAGSAEFYLSKPDKDGSHGLSPNRYSDLEQRIEIQKQRLEVLFSEQGLDRIDFIKIDTEGHDLQALEGCGDWLQPERIRVLYIEMAEDKEAILEALLKAGYCGWRSQKYLFRDVRNGLRPAEHRYFKPFDPERDKISRNMLFCGQESEENAFLKARFVSSTF